MQIIFIIKGLDFKIPKKIGYMLVIIMLAAGQMTMLAADETSKVASVQQQITVTGTITDEQGEPLPGASVSVKGSTRGVTTDIDGTFSINVRPTDVLVISFLGYESFETSVENRQKIDVSLKPKAN